MIEKIQMWIAWRIPRWLARLAFVRVSTHASFVLSERELPGITVVEALEQWK
mgnify:FL=1